MPTSGLRAGWLGAGAASPLEREDQLPRSTLVMFAASFFTLLIAGAAATTIAVRANDAERLVTHALQVSQATEEIINTLHLAETSQRGYLLTADPRFLAPHAKAEAALPSAVRNLGELLEQTTIQHVSVGDLASLIDQRLADLRARIAELQRGDLAAARDRELLSRGQALTVEIRQRLTSIPRVEHQYLENAQSEAARLRSLLITLVAISLAATVALSLLVGRAIRHYIRRLAARTGELEAEIRRRRETEETLRQSQKMEAIGQLTGGIAHDFNNLLTIIIGNLDTVRRRIASASTSDSSGHFATTLLKPVENAIRGSRSAAQLTHRLLAFSRRQALEPANVDLNRLITSMSDMLRRTLDDNVEMETVLAAGLWPTFVDANQVENVLLNLVLNARDAMPNGGRLTVETANSYLDEAYTWRFGDVTPGQYVMLSVTDTGSGMSPDVLEHAFEPFFTTKARGAGSGLGLAMVHGFVKQSQGHVRIYSEVGQGTTVKVYLPRSTETAAVPANPPGVDTPITTPPRAAANETLLVVEDNADVRDYAVSVLEDLGYRVIEAADAEGALSALESTPPIDLLFTDVVLPGSASGRDLAEKLKERYPGLPVLFTTGYTRNAIVHNGRLDAKVHLLNKPYTQQELARKIRELLDAAKASRSPG